MLENIVDFEWLLCIFLQLILVALLVHRRAYRSHSLFVASSSYELLANAALKVFQSKLYIYYVFIPRELVSDAFTLGIAFTESERVFRYYPGIRRSLKSLLVLLLLLSLGYSFYLPGIFRSDLDFWYNLILQLHPRLLSSAAFLFLIITMSINYYNLKVDRADKVIILGFLIHLGPNALGYVFLDRLTDSVTARNVINVFYLGFYLVALGLWISLYWPRHDVVVPTNDRPP